MQGPMSAYWVFTINNPEEKPEELEAMFQDKYKKLAFQLEKGEEGTLHYQGCVDFKERLRLTSLKKIHAKAHWERQKGSWSQSLTYCTKEETREDGPWTFNCEKPKPKWTILTNPEDRTEWQQEIFRNLDGPVNHRNIYWYWENCGNVGKTKTALDMHTLYPSGLIVSGKASDIKAAIASLMREGKPEPHFVCWDLPRSREGYIDYAALEEVKNGVFFSGKYESGMVRMEKQPHIVVFANFAPEEDKISKDRWVVRDINIKGLYPMFEASSKKLE